MQYPKWCAIACLAAMAFGWSGSTARAAVTSSGDTEVAKFSFAYTYVGIDAAGTLSINGGSTLTNHSGYLGYNPGSGGTATVSGAGSKWTNNSTLSVGNYGSGTLRVEAGAQITAPIAYLGYYAGASGAATVTGANSKWTINNILYVGRDGTGTLTVADGGLVTAKALYASLDDLYGNGTITISGGALLDADLVFDSTHGTTQALAFGTGGMLNVTFTSGDVLGVGYKGNGSLRIAEGVAIASTNGFIGYYAGSSAAATVTGAGSRWTNSSILVVGSYGDGTLRVESGAQVSSMSGYVGRYAGATGAVTVSGAGAQWTNTDSLYIGGEGSGTLTVADGGVVTAKALYASMNSLAGNGTINTNGALLDAVLVFDSTHGTTQTLPFGTGGNLNLAVSPSYVLGAGYKASGSLRVAEGVTVASYTGHLGHYAGSTGSATVSGAGSKWTNTSDLYVGNYGRGTVRVESSGQLSNASAYLGYYAGSSATATVSGSGATWTGSQFYVGRSGTAELTIEAGGQVSSANTSYLGYNATASGAATIRGAGSKWTINSQFHVGESGSGTLRVEDSAEMSSSGDSFVGYNANATGSVTVSSGATWNATSICIGRSGNGTLRVDSGGQFNNTFGYVALEMGSTGAATVSGAGSAWTNTAHLYLGAYGSGTLRVEAGGQLSNGNGYFGQYAGATGDATVTGAGSKWTNTGALYVGDQGSGTLTVNDGGLVTAQTLFASMSSLAGNGTIAARGAVLDTNLIFDGAHGTTQTMAFGSGGALNLALDGSGNLGAGYKAAGSLRIAGSVTVTSAAGELGRYAGSSATATVIGAGSKWTNSGALNVGAAGSGTLRIESGGQVSNTIGTLGVASGSSGAATVSGTNSKWTNSGNLTVGESGGGTLRIEAGGQVVNNAATIARNAGTTGSVTVSGAGSQWSNGNLIVGNQGAGTLRIEAGGEVTSSYGYLGNDTIASSGTVVVTGAGSKWTNTYGVSIGKGGQGTLRIEDGGQVSAYSASIGYYNDYSGAVTVTGPGSKWTLGEAISMGTYGSGTLTLSDGAQIATRAVGLSAHSTVRLHISNSGMLVLGNPTNVGNVYNTGVFALYADAMLPGGVYAPVTELKGRPMAWTGTGSYPACGGTWSSTALTLNVAPATTLAAGASHPVASGGRLLFTDAATGRRAGASFGALSGSLDFTATPTSSSSLAELLPLLEPDTGVLAAWDFATGPSGAAALAAESMSAAGSEIFLSFDIGPGATDLTIWRQQGAGWSTYTPSLLTYDSHGVASFTADSPGSYAVAAVPEPAAWLLLVAFVAVGVILRRAK